MKKLVHHRGLLAVVALAILAGNVSAGNCASLSYGKGYAVQANYGHQVQYAAHNNYANNYIAVVAQAVPYYVPLQAYTSVGDDARSYYTTKDAVKAGVLEAYRELLASGANPSYPPPNGTIQPSTAPATPAAKVQAMVNAKCISCHADTNGIDLTDVTKMPSLTKSGKDARAEIVLRIMAPDDEDGFMPKPKNGKAPERVSTQELNAAHAFAREIKAPVGPPEKIPPAKKEVLSEIPGKK